MKSDRVATRAAVLASLLCVAKLLSADTVTVQFAGVVTQSSGPAVYAGESFSGGFTYSTTDPFMVAVGGQSEYLLTSPDDSKFVSVGTFSLVHQPLTGVYAIVVPGPTSCFFTQDFVVPGATGISLQFCGGPNFAGSGALPDPFNVQDFTFGDIGFVFSADDVSYSVQGDITEVSTVPEPRGLGFACLVILPLAVLRLRRAA